jgi:Xaa-Pro aminopeptidase
MFSREIYAQRRKKLVNDVESGLILFLGNEEIPMNYSGNTFRFRQDSSFIYFFGLDLPGLAAVIDADSDEAILFGDDPGLDDIIWMGAQPLLKDLALNVNVDQVKPSSELALFLKKARAQKRIIHYLPPYQAAHIIKISDLTGQKVDLVKQAGSEVLIRSVIAQRSIKTAEEIEQIEQALAITYKMHTTAMRMARAGLLEREIAGVIEGIALSGGPGPSFPVILSVRGEILHNHHHDNVLQNGDLVINDSGAESELHYAGDITRTFPVSGRFTPQQKDVYEIVLAAQMAARKFTCNVLK